MKKQIKKNNNSTIDIKGFVIIQPPIFGESSYELSTRTFATSEVGSWKRFIGYDMDASKVQYWFDRGYRIKPAKLTIEIE